jgi:acetyl-CoA/propionyl-CoA carboxylase biotin carboxyl carrier protein
MDVRGVATTIPADVAILEHPDFRAATHSTKWVEDTLDLSEVGSSTDPGDDAGDQEPTVRKDISVEVDGKRFAVSMWVPEAAPAAGRGPSRSKRPGAASSASGSGEVTVPMQGTIIKVLVAVGDTVEAGEGVCVLEAMKMENTVAAGKDGTVTEVRVVPGDSVGSGDVVVVIE